MSISKPGKLVVIAWCLAVFNIAGSPAFGQTSADTQQHAGLLGRAYIEGQYFKIEPGDDLAELSADLDGAVTMLNIPIPWDAPFTEFISQDVFIGYRQMNLKGRTIIGPAATVDASLESLMFGTTLWGNATPRFRPFVQLGASRDDSEFSMSSAFGPFTINESETRFLSIVGAEYDIRENTALRTALDIDFNDNIAEDFSDSLLTVELVQWFGRHVYLRGGIMGDLSADSLGGIIGGGLAY